MKSHAEELAELFQKLHIKSDYEFYQSDKRIEIAKQIREEFFPEGLTPEMDEDQVNAYLTLMHIINSKKTNK